MSYLRSRSRLLSQQTVQMTTTQSLSGTVTISGPYTLTDSDSISDYVTPLYHRKIADGVIINNPCTYSRVFTRSRGSGMVTASYKSNPSNSYSQSGAVTYARMYQNLSYLGLSDTTTESAREKAVSDVKQSAIANIAKSQWSFGEDVAEARETMRYLRRPAASLAEVSKAFERKARNLYYRYGNRTKALSGAWASYRFAMLPLQRSLEDIVKSSFDRNIKEFEAGQRLSARSKLTLNGSSSRTTPVGTRVYSETRSDEIIYHAYILYETSSPLKGWQYRYGLRFRDIPSTAWQVVPYSFMVDRVANVTKCVQGATNLADPSIRILAAGVVSKRDTLKTCRFITDTNPLWTFSANGETIEYGDFTYNRTTWTPEASDTLPSIDLRGLVNDTTKVLDLLALTTLRLKCF